LQNLRAEERGIEAFLVVEIEWSSSTLGAMVNGQAAPLGQVGFLIPQLFLNFVLLRSKAC